MLSHLLTDNFQGRIHFSFFSSIIYSLPYPKMQNVHENCYKGTMSGKPIKLLINNLALIFCFAKGRL